MYAWLFDQQLYFRISWAVAIVLTFVMNMYIFQHCAYSRDKNWFTQPTIHYIWDEVTQLLQRTACYKIQLLNFSKINVLLHWKLVFFFEIAGTCVELAGGQHSCSCSGRPATPVYITKRIVLWSTLHILCSCLHPPPPHTHTTWNRKYRIQH